MSIWEFVHDPGFPVYTDARKVDEYLCSGHTLPPLMTSIGEPSFTAAQVPQRLLELVRNAPPELHGYQASMGGFPVARRAIANYLMRTMHLNEVAQHGEDFQIALTAGGTRGVMGDFARLLQSRSAALGVFDTPVALCADPCWDYAGPLVEAGFEMAYWPLRAENDWLPDIADARRVAEQIGSSKGKRLAMVIVNSQHNPTGRGWPLGTLTSLFALASAYGAGILLDDPYFEVRTTDAIPVSAPAALLGFLATADNAALQLDWCAVRSLGKQLGVNGWGVGTLTAHPSTLEDLLHHAFRRRFPSNAHQEWAVAQYLADPASESDAVNRRHALTEKRKRFSLTLQQLGWPKGTISRGEFTPYVLVAVPPAWAGLPNGEEIYRDYLFERTGILVAHASIERPSLTTPMSDLKWVRFYLGVSDEVFDEVLERLRSGGLAYDSDAL